ncbi:uncharacterized protein [Drosophila takahashii]|uniref:uncharacterized protein n=1 Tax=Drosophila takahashii TaxID=29030 RepID=UPI0007E75EB5|nr:uncharacterized protein LOC108063562 [Drosophila takahashii]
MELKVILLAVLSFLYHSNGAVYELVVYDEYIFSSCPDPAPGTLDIHGFLDLSEFSTEMDSDGGVTVSGNTTLVWDIQLGDRVEFAVKLFYLDRGTWTPTMFSVLIRDFCKVMYDKNQIWYNVWTRHITNDIKDKCVNVPGMKIMLEKYVLNLTVTGPIRDGRHKAYVTFRAFDAFNVERPTSICYEIISDLYKVQK